MASYVILIRVFPHVRFQLGRFLGVDLPPAVLPHHEKVVRVDDGGDERVLLQGNVGLVLALDVVVVLKLE